jgi:Glycosyl transferase family 2
MITVALSLLLLVLLAFLGLSIQNLQLYLPLKRTVADTSLRVSVCIPARNEAENIAQIVTAVLNQSYPNIELIVLDDCSTDNTAHIATDAAAGDARFRLIQGGPIQPGWAGKCHACAQLSNAAQGEALLFLDADTRPQPHLVAGLVDAMQHTHAELVSGFPKQITGTFSEALILPMLQSLVISFLPLSRLNMDRSPALAAACGQVLFMDAEAYRAVGGHGAIRSSFHDGLQLARQFKRTGRAIALMDLNDSITCRMYQGWRQVFNGFTRNAYEGLGSPAALVTMVSAVLTLFVVPYAAFAAAMASHWSVKARLLAAACAVVSVTIRAVQAKRFGHWLSVLLMPLSACGIVLIQAASAVRKQNQWKGRTYGAEPVVASSQTAP